MKETDISVTILMSVYNGETYLPQAIESILQQTYQQFEFIIINDGSTDTSWRIIQQYAAKDPRIVPILQENIGLTRSLNKGIQLSKGEFIARQDADDLSLPTRLAEQLPWVRERGYDLCCSRTWLMEKCRATPSISYWLPKKLLMLKQNPFVHGTYLMRKDRLQALGGYDEFFRYAQDYELMTRWIDNGFTVKYLRNCLYQSRMVNNSISISRHSEQNEYARMIRHKWRKNILKILTSRSYL